MNDTRPMTWRRAIPAGDISPTSRHVLVLLWRHGIPVQILVL
jgi:hypothetical protein